MNYSIYLFDFDYTLADSEKGIVGSFHHTLKARGFAPVPDEHIRRTIGLPMEDAVRQITGLQDIAQVTAFIEEYRCFADTYMTPNTRFFPETIPTLQTLRARGAHTAVISTKTRSRIAEKFEQDGVMHLLDFIIGREDVAVPKPARRESSAPCSDWAGKRRRHFTSATVTLTPARPKMPAQTSRPSPRERQPPRNSNPFPT